MLNSVIRREEEAEIEAKSSYTKAKESGEKKRDSARYEAQAAWERAQDRVERAEKTHQKALFMKMRAEAASRNYTQLAEEHGMRWQEASTKLQMAREQLERKRAQMLEAEHLRGRVEDNANADMYQAKDAVDHARQVFLGHEESLAKLSVDKQS